MIHFGYKPVPLPNAVIPAVVKVGTMVVVYGVTSELREKFKIPFGLLIQGSFYKTMRRMEELVQKENPSRIVSVGDVVSANLHDYKLHPQLTIIDNKSLRDKAAPEDSAAERIVRVCNPPGTITEEAIEAIKDALEKNEHSHIVVDGEEDLLVLIAVLYAPRNSFVVYGQPYQGIVVVRVTEEKKAQVREFLKAMKPSKS